MILILNEKERNEFFIRRADFVALYLGDNQYRIIKSRIGELKVCNHIELGGEIEKVYASKVQRHSV